MTEHVLSGLVKCRAELTGEADALRTRFVAITTDLGHLDAVIRLFDPDYDLGAIRSKRPREADATRPGELARFVLGVLREATEPMPTPDIALRLMAERGLDQTRRSRVRDMTKRVGTALRHQEQRGVVRSQSGTGRVLLWNVVE